MVGIPVSTPGIEGRNPPIQGQEEVASEPGK